MFLDGFKAYRYNRKIFLHQNITFFTLYLQRSRKISIRIKTRPLEYQFFSRADYSNLKFGELTFGKFFPKFIEQCNLVLYLENHEYNFFYKHLIINLKHIFVSFFKTFFKIWSFYQKFQFHRRFLKSNIYKNLKN